MNQHVIFLTEMKSHIHGKLACDANRKPLSVQGEASKDLTEEKGIIFTAVMATILGISITMVTVAICYNMIRTKTSTLTKVKHNNTKCTCMNVTFVILWPY